MSRSRCESQRTVFWLLLSSAAVAGCRDDRTTLGWSELFDVQEPVLLSDSAAHSIRSDTLRRGARVRIVRTQLADEIASWTSVTGLREGRFTNRPDGIAGVAIFGAMSSHNRDLAASYIPTPRVIYETPYWVSLDYYPLSAVGNGRIFVATNLFYPVRVYDTTRRLLDSMSVPPRSWRDLRSPDQGEFVDASGEPRAAYTKWLQDFTLITGLAVVTDSVLIIAHGAYRARTDGILQIEPTTSDIYMNGYRVATDLPSPGEILAYSRTSVYFLVPKRSDDNWRVVEYRRRTD